MTKPAPYTITNESITVIHNGKPVIVKRGSTNFAGLLDALISENWDAVPNHLSAARSLAEWAKGRFTIVDDVLQFDGAPIPQGLNHRASQMAAAGEDITPLLRFWERLAKNPSYRSVNQVYPFLQHQGIPIDPDGFILAYKAVKADFTDVYTGKFVNKPGSIHEMPRNQISDDPNHACHEGFHVGALEYARGFGDSDRKIVVCKIDPEHVVCVPYDESHKKMRVCKYEVIGHHAGQHLPSTTFDHQEERDFEEELDDGVADGIPSMPHVHTKQKAGGRFKRFDKMDSVDLLSESIQDLRVYAAAGLQIVGASKVPGGKVGIVEFIISARGY